MKRTILAVDDEQNVIESITQILEDEYQIIGVHSCEEAMSIIHKTPLHLIILDLNLGHNVNGLETCRGLREVGNYIPIILCSGVDPIVVEEYGLKMGGADAFLRKPFDKNELSLQVQLLIRRTYDYNINKGEFIDVGHVYLSRSQHIVRVYGKQKRLTPKEFNFLEILLRNANNVISLETLLAELFNKDEMKINTKAPQQLFYRLKTALGDKVSDRFICIDEIGYVYRFPLK